MASKQVMNDSALCDTFDMLISRLERVEDKLDRALIAQNENRTILLKLLNESEQRRLDKQFKNYVIFESRIDSPNCQMIDGYAVAFRSKKMWLGSTYVIVFPRIMESPIYKVVLTEKMQKQLIEFGISEEIVDLAISDPNTLAKDHFENAYFKSLPSHLAAFLIEKEYRDIIIAPQGIVIHSGDLKIAEWMPLIKRVSETFSVKATWGAYNIYTVHFSCEVAASILSHRRLEDMWDELDEDDRMCMKNDLDQGDHSFIKKVALYQPFYKMVKKWCAEFTGTA